MPGVTRGVTLYVTYYTKSGVGCQKRNGVKWEPKTEYNVTLADVYAALAYYYDHQADIDTAIKEDEAFIEALRQVSPSKLPEKLRGGTP